MVTKYAMYGEKINEHNGRFGINMKIKNFIYSFLLIVLLAVWMTAFGENTVFERSNHKKCIETARRIGENQSVVNAAVLKRQGAVIMGITAEDAGAELPSLAEGIARQMFPGAKEVYAQVNSKLAEDIIELSYYVDSGMNEDIQKGRFDFLKGECSKVQKLIMQ